MSNAGPAATSTAAPQETFAALFEESLTRKEMRTGEVITAEVVRVDVNYVVVNAGLKSESFIAAEEFKNEKGEVEVKPGDFVSVAIEALEDGYGETRLSRDKAKRLAAWMDLEKALEAGTLVKGMISGKVKGGLTVMTNGIRAFLPGSLVDIRPVKDTMPYEGKEMEFKVIKLDRKRNNVVVSRRAVLEASQGAERQALLANLQEGATVKGIVKNITDYGAFVDLGGIDGLLHITDLAWRRVKHPSEVLAVGDEVTAKVLKFDTEKNRVSLGMKQLGEDPWVGLSRRYPAGTRLFGKVTNLTDYGAFVEVEQGIEGLVHVSEMDWTNKNVHPSKVVALGDEVEVMILEIDEERRRISLGMKQCMPNPWEEFGMNFKKGDKVKGPIKSITDFGIFIGLTGGIDGLVHLSDLSWTTPGEEAVRNFKKGEEVEAQVLSIDVERERISLGIKQIEGDPFNSFLATNEKGKLVSGTVKSVDARGAVVSLGGDLEGYLRASEISRDRVEDARTHLKEGDTVNAMIINVDRKNRTINLSVKQKDLADENAAMAKLQSESAASTGSTNLGRAAEGEAGQQERSTVTGDRHDQVRTDREACCALFAARGQGRRIHGEDGSGRDDPEPGEGAAHRDPRVRKLRVEPPAGTRRPQPEVGRESAGPGEVRPAFQGGQGIAREGGPKIRKSGRRYLSGGIDKVPPFCFDEIHQTTVMAFAGAAISCDIRIRADEYRYGEAALFSGEHLGDADDRRAAPVLRLRRRGRRSRLHVAAPRPAPRDPAAAARAAGGRVPRRAAAGLGAPWTSTSTSSCGGSSGSRHSSALDGSRRAWTSSSCSWSRGTCRVRISRASTSC